jgi:hypothetical protein
MNCNVYEFGVSDPRVKGYVRRILFIHIIIYSKRIVLLSETDNTKVFNVYIHVLLFIDILQH